MHLAQNLVPHPLELASGLEDTDDEVPRTPRGASPSENDDENEDEDDEEVSVIDLEDTDDEPSPGEMERQLLEVEKKVIPLMRKPAAAPKNPAQKKPSAAVPVMKKPAAAALRSSEGGFRLKKMDQRKKFIFQVQFPDGRAAAQVQGQYSEETALKKAAEVLLAHAQSGKWKTLEQCKQSLELLKKSDGFWD